MKDITCINEVAREKIERFGSLDLNSFIDNIIKDKDYVTILDTLYIDAFIVLNYKEKIGILSNYEQKLLKKLITILIEDFTLYIVFQNDKDFIKQIVEQSSIFRNSTQLIKSKMYYLLTSIDKNILSKIDYRFLSELNIYSLNFEDIKKYIQKNINKKDISFQIYDYLTFLYLNNPTKYNQIVYGIRRYNKEINTDNITLEEIETFIKNINLNSIKVKIYDISKKRW